VRPRAYRSASPTESTTSTTHSDRPYSQHSGIQQAPVHPISAEAYQSLQEYSHPPPYGHRQDSAVFHQRETSKDGYFAPIADPYSSYPQRTSRQSTSPGLAAYHLPLSSALSAPSAAPAYSVAPSARSHEHMSMLTAPALHHSREPASSNVPQIPPQDNPSRQRYNVRFAAPHTSANMPSARPRHSPPLPSAPVIPAETTDSPSPPQEQGVHLTVEPTSQAPSFHQASEELPPPEERVGESSVERCSRCFEPWIKPLFDSSTWPQRSTATSSVDFAMAAENATLRMRQYKMDNEQKYELWKEKHRQCPPNVNDRASSAEMQRGRPTNGQAQVHEPPKPASNKRKATSPQGDYSKMRKILFDPPCPTTTHRPSPDRV
jgi:hypothetical protein